jgi:hypothetical protein
MEVVRLLRRAALPLCLLGLVQWFMWTAGGGLSPGQLAAPESYARVSRVLDLAEHGRWYDHAVTRANTPFGTNSESTRAMDLVLLGGAAAGAPLVGLERALEFWAFAVGPLLHVLTLLVLMWALEPILGARTVWAGALFPFQILLSQQFATGHADHRSLLILLLAWLIGCTLRALRPGAQSGHAALAGIAASLAAWAAVQGLAGAAIVSIAFALIWLSGFTSVARHAFIFTAVVSVGLATAAALEHPPALLLDSTHRSVFAAHAFAFSVAAGAWLACGLLSSWTSERTWRRTFVVMLAVIAASSVIYLHFPDLFASDPLTVGPEGANLLLEDLSPTSALVDTGVPLLEAVGLLLMHFGPLLFALPYLRQAPRHARQHPRHCWLLVSWALAVTVPLAVRDLRWAPMAQLFLLVPYAALAGGLVERLRPHGPILRGALAATAGILFACLFPAGGARLAAAAPSREPASEQTVSRPAGRLACEVPALATGLDAAWRTPQRVLTFVAFGPELIYRSRHEVVGTPSMPNVEGILDTIDFFATDDPRVAREVLQRRGILLVVACSSHAEATGYRAEGNSMLDLLESGRQPVWLQKLSPTTVDAPGFLVFRVRR